MKKAIVGLVMVGLFGLSSLSAAGKKEDREYYKIIVYHFRTVEQKTALDSYLQSAFVPALHRLGIKSIGVFTPIANDTAIDKRIYIVIPAKSLKAINDMSSTLQKDVTYQQDAKKYLEAEYNNPPFARMETILLYAFPDAPSMVLPKLNSQRADRVYELRSYESPTEKLFRNKVQMFNEGGEVTLFKRLNFNAVFYAEVIAGASMPNLMYMTSFENMDDRTAHWKTFGADPEWKKLSSDPQYQHNVSRSDVILMKATDYSDY